MNTQMYNLVKNAIKDGSSIEDIVNEVNTLAKTAQDELKPQYPIRDKYNRAAVKYEFTGDARNYIGIDNTVTALALYLVQSGFVPDICYHTEAEFRDAVEGIISRGLSAAKTTEKILRMEKNGASEAQMTKEMFNSIGDLFREAFTQIIDSKD